MILKDFFSQILVILKNYPESPLVETQLLKPHYKKTQHKVSTKNV